MKSTFLKIALIFGLVLISVFNILTTRGSAVVFCPEDRQFMPIQTTLPWGAVGYMDNGCTATLIDQDHIAAAAHCFVWDDTGAWQTNLYFYPNFNPERSNPPSVAIDRAVVGARVATGGEYMASDWGIGHLASPVTDFPSMRIGVVQTVPRDVRSSGYGRESHFFSPGPAPPGGVSKMDGNVWWQYALTDPECKVYKIDKDNLFFDCATIGGNSGSPIFYPSGLTYALTGVIHGGPCFLYWHGWWRISNIQVPEGSPVTVASRGPDNLDVFVVGQDGGIYTAAWGPQTNYEWQGWWRVLNLEAQPGSYIGAVSRSPNKLDIFVTGRDGKVYSAAWDPSFTDGWHGWWRISDIQVPAGSPVTVASRGPNNLDIFVVGQDGGIYTAAWGSQTGYEWQGWWRVLNLQAQTLTYVGAVSRSADKLDIFVTGNDGKVYTAAWEPSYGTSWSGWWTIPGIQAVSGAPVSGAARGPDNLDIFVVGQDKGIHSAAWGAQTGYAWQDQGNISTGLQFPTDSFVTAVSRSAGKLNIFVAGYDGAVYQNTFDPGSCEWCYWCTIINQKVQPGACVSPVSRSTDWIDIFLTGQDKGIYTASWNPDFTCELVGNQGPSLDRLNVGPSARRFVYAPRFASNVALARFVDGTARTQIFATDTDTGMIVTRYRMGTQVDDVFSPFCRLGDVPSPQRIAAFLQTNARPQVLVTSNNGNLYSNAVKTDNTWAGWMTMDKPSGVGSFLDVDAAYDAEGTNQIYVIGNNKRLYTRRRLNKQPDSPWTAWQSLTAYGDYRKVTSIRRANGTQQVFMVTSGGKLSTLWQTQAIPGSAWTQPSNFGTPHLTSIVDIDAAWTEDEAIQLFAVDTNGKLWIRVMFSSDPAKGWSTWQDWATSLYAPSASISQPPPFRIESLTASRWQEETGGDIVPVVFATDNQGNIYFTTHSRSSWWSPWRSFYDGYIEGKYLSGFDQDNDGYTVGEGDCDDSDHTVNPGALEICNDIDNNCNGVVLEIGALNCKDYYKDQDHDGYGVSGDSLCLCLPAPLIGYTALKGGDPDDNDPNVPKTKTATFALDEGWSMVSMPVIPDTNNLSNLFPEAVVVYSYQKGTGYIRVKTEEEIEPGKGYWILLNSNKDYILTGRVLDEYSIILTEDGWYMIGGCTDPARASIVDGEIGVIYKYSKVFGYQRVLESDQLEPGNGYWILIRNAGNRAELNVKANVINP